MRKIIVIGWVWLLTCMGGASYGTILRTHRVDDPTNPEDTLWESLQSKVKIWSSDSLVSRRRVANHRFIQDLGRLIRTQKSWDLPWHELYPVSVLNSPDGVWKVLTWTVLLEQNARRHYGCLMDAQGRLYPLLDQQANRFEEDSIYLNQNWPGSVYIEALPIQASWNNLPCFAVIGFDAREPFSQRKVVDWLCPDTLNNQVMVGAPLIRKGNKPMTRYQLHYPRDVRVQMKWDDDQGLVYFDHLISRGLDPSSSSFDFIPDGSFDGLVWENDRLVFKEIPNYQPSR